VEEEQCPAPGLGLAVTLECLQGSTSLGAAYEFAVYPDLGASIGGAADQPLDTAFATTFDCIILVTGPTAKAEAFSQLR
jgi:hypothetical protein